MTYSANAVAAELRLRLPGVPVKKLHKLLYYTQGHHLASFGDPLFSETISCWDMGPVVGSLWKDEKSGEGSESLRLGGLDEGALNTIGYVVSRYGSLTGTDLEHLTHGEAPWREADRGRRPGTSVRMPVDSLRDYFATAWLDDDSDAVPLDAEAVSAWLVETVKSGDQVGQPDSLEELRSRLTRTA